MWTVRRLFIDDTWETAGDFLAKDIIDILNDKNATWWFYELPNCTEIRYKPEDSPKMVIARKMK